MKDYDIKLKEKADTWVKEKPKVAGKTIRLTIDLDADVHQKLKMRCVAERITIADMMRRWIEEKLHE
jgi:hypothetical protein